MALSQTRKDALIALIDAAVEETQTVFGEVCTSFGLNDEEEEFVRERALEILEEWTEETLLDIKEARG